MKSVKGTQTEKNLLAAFAGESQARNRYTYAAAQARNEGYVQIAELFEETANQEEEHAKRYFTYLEGGDCEITAGYPAGFAGEGAVPNTAENLANAAAGEHFEWTELYTGFAEVAKEEGFPEIAAQFTAVCVAEKQHEKRYNKLRANLLDGSVFKREGSTVWACMNCGYVFEGAEPPRMCPACKHPQGYFELIRENW
ncbi:MAG: rubrerythrin family protein [Spirochaetia bacterium]